MKDTVQVRTFSILHKLHDGHKSPILVDEFFSYEEAFAIVTALGKAARRNPESSYWISGGTLQMHAEDYYELLEKYPCITQVVE